MFYFYCSVKILQKLFLQETFLMLRMHLYFIQFCSTNFVFSSNMYVTWFVGFMNCRDLQVEAVLNNAPKLCFDFDSDALSFGRDSRAQQN